MSIIIKFIPDNILNDIQKRKIIEYKLLDKVLTLNEMFNYEEGMPIHYVFKDIEDKDIVLWCEDARKFNITCRECSEAERHHCNRLYSIGKKDEEIEENGRSWNLLVL